MGPGFPYRVHGKAGGLPPLVLKQLLQGLPVCDLQPKTHSRPGEDRRPHVPKVLVQFLQMAAYRALRHPQTVGQELGAHRLSRLPEPLQQEPLKPIDPRHIFSPFKPQERHLKVPLLEWV